MLVQVTYWNQIRAARGLKDETVELAESATLGDLLKTIGEFEDMQKFLFDEVGQLSPSILIDRGGEMVRAADTELADGDHIRVFTSISGG